MDEWIEHDGKGYPDLPHDTHVVVKFRDGTGENWSSETVGFWFPDDEDDPTDYWVHDESNNDITHYRVVAK